jgi:hypothetical protein
MTPSITHREKAGRTNNYKSKTYQIFKCSIKQGEILAISSIWLERKGNKILMGYTRSSKII